MITIVYKIVGQTLFYKLNTNPMFHYCIYYTLLKLYFIFYFVYGLLASPISFVLIRMHTVSFVNGSP
jgi:hypothetical protein